MTTSPLLECVPNFSEGRDKEKITAIADAIRTVKEVNLLEIDPGKSANRTVMTFTGPPEAVSEAAFQGVKKAAEIIDMQEHKGEHPRFGATDVCPLVPLRGITMDETIKYADRLARRVGNELNIPVYLYEEAAVHPERRDLARIRKGEFEGLTEKLQDPFWKPDYGPATANKRSGAVAIGARHYLIAYNVNLSTRSKQIAHEIAVALRESGGLKDDPLTEQVHEEKRKLVRVAGTLKKVKAIGWYIDDFGCAQVSMNLTDWTITPMHIAFEEVKRFAKEKGISVTGSELVGLIPEDVLLQAGLYYAEQNKIKVDKKSQLINLAVKNLGLDDLKPFDAGKKVIEYLMNE